MLQTKSFNLIKEDDSKKAKSSEYGYLRFFVIPGLISFALLLILFNVDFSGSSKRVKNKISVLSNVSTQNSQSIILEKTIDVLNDAYKELNSSSVILPANNVKAIKFDFCEEVSNDKCKLKCIASSFDRKQLIKHLEQKYKNCPSKLLDVTLEFTRFEESKFEKSDLNGNFQMLSLTFTHCFLEAISDFAFDKTSTKSLESLVINESKLTKMTPNTFAGLIDLKFFTMINEKPFTVFEARGFVKPMAKTLSEFYFCHRSGKMQNFDPGVWLEGSDLIKLRKANFKGNFFNDTLKSTSFVTLKEVEILILQNCNIEVMEDDAFDIVFGTLKFLDLRDNRLKVLSPHFINTSPSTVVVDIENNRLDCSCDNYEMLEAFRSGKMNFTLEPICSAPMNVSGVIIKTSQFCCKGIEAECFEETSTKQDTSAETETTEKIIEPLQFIMLKCKSFLDEKDSSSFDILVRDKLVHFRIQTLTDTSIKLILGAIPAFAYILYFTSNNSDIQHSGEVSVDFTVIDGLKANQSYIFCIVQYDVEQTSPFNCRSHFVGCKINPHYTRSWLRKSDLVLFVTLTTIGAVLFLLFGLISIYLLLRCRPSLSGANQQFTKSESNKQRCLTLLDDGTYEAFRVPSNDYGKYLKKSEVPAAEMEVANRIENLPPHIRAPALPPLCSSLPVSTRSTKMDEDLSYLGTIADDFNEHEYQCLDTYQLIYEKYCYVDMN